MSGTNSGYVSLSVSVRGAWINLPHGKWEKKGSKAQKLISAAAKAGWTATTKAVSPGLP